MDGDLVAALRHRGVRVSTVLAAGLIEKSVGEQLAFAAEHACALYTFNVSDFYRLHTMWAAAERDHAGIILAPQRRCSVGEQLRRILRLRAAVPLESMLNHVEFLSHWS